jgi:hypothetical protein
MRSELENCFNAEGYRREALIARSSLISSTMTMFFIIRFFAQKQPNRQENRLFFVELIHSLEEPRVPFREKNLAQQK